MSDYKYTTVPGKLEDLLERVRSTGVPSRANREWLETLGYTSSNDRTMPRVLKALGFVDGQNRPTERWKRYRGHDHRKVLGEGLREGYAGLFDLYPDACARGDAELESFFRTQTTAGEQAVKKMVATFKVLCANADTGAAASIGGKPEVPKEGVDGDQNSGDPGKTLYTPPSDGMSLSPSIHLDIQIHISPESSAEQIDQIFKSMAKYLYHKDD